MTDWEIRGKPALVILHMQQGIIGREGNIAGSFEAVSKAGIIPRQQKLLKAFRDKKLPVMYVVASTVNKEHSPTGKLPAYGKLFGMIEAREPVPNSMEIIPELPPQRGEPVLYNWFIGAFSNSGLDQVLKARGAETPVITGYATHIAVYTAAIQSVDLMYSVILVSDACTSQEPLMKAHEAVMEIMGPTIGLVTTTEDVIAHL